MHRLNLSESNEEVSERLSKFEKEIDSVEADQVKLPYSYSEELTSYYK